jgi:RNA polymerase sigma factor (sigma-70 family)
MALDFATVYDQQVFHVYGFFAYRVSSRADAEDLTQLTFERALKAWPRYDPRRSAPGTWLFAIARNLLIDHYRADRSSSQSSLDADDRFESQLPRVDGPEASLGLSPELAEALAVLTDRDREVLALRFGGDLNGPEIAEVMGLTLANVQQILSRSLRRLRGELDAAGADVR